MTQARLTPNPRSNLLRLASVAAAGITSPSALPPPGRGEHAVMVLWVSAAVIGGMSETEARDDLGIPWVGDPVGPADRNIPNPGSVLLREAVVGCAGLGRPLRLRQPIGKGVVILYLPIDALLGASMPEMQGDLGLPWSDEEGNPVWFDEL